MKVVISGGIGFIGSRLARLLLDQSFSVRIIDNLSPQIHGYSPSPAIPAGAEFVHADVRELADSPDLLDGFDAVVHLAAETGTAQSMYEIRRYVDVNEGGTAALLEAIGKCAAPPKKVVLASSRSVYGEGAYRDAKGALRQPRPRSALQLSAGEWDQFGPEGEALEPIPTPEHIGFAPGSVYAATKASQELLLASAAEALGIKTAILRLQNVFGEGQSLQNPYTGIISIFYNRARQGLMLPIYEDGLETRDFVHVDDVALAMLACLREDATSGIVCNIGSGIATPVRTLAQKLAAAAGFEVEIAVTGQFRLGDIRHNVADITLAKQRLGYEPTISLDEGLKRFCAWAAQQPVFEDRLDHATAELRERGLAS